MFFNICENSNILSAILFAKELINIISIFVPIILIIMLSVELLKIVVSGDDNGFKKHSKSIVTKAIAAVAIFFIPTLVNLLLSMLNKVSYNDTLCWVNATDETIADYKTLEEARNKVEEEKIAAEKKKSEEERKALAELREQARIENEKKAEEAEKENNNGNDNGNNSGNSASKTFAGTKYNLTESQLIALARVCTAEQGSVNGAAAEASLMANLFENTSGFGSGASGLYNYVRTSGWFSNAASKMDSGSYTPEILAAVKDVLINGNRILPTDVVEHDCWFCNSKRCSNGNEGDICKIVTNGTTMTSESDISNRNNYVQDNTVIYNVYGSIYKFYTFPSDNSDPFGYIIGYYNP